MTHTDFSELPPRDTAAPLLPRHQGNPRSAEGAALQQIAREDARARLAERPPIHDALGLHPELWTQVHQALGEAEVATYEAAPEAVTAEHEALKRAAAQAVRVGRDPEPIPNIDDLRAVAEGAALAKVDALRAARRAYDAAVEAEPVDEAAAIQERLAEAGPAAVRALTQARAALAALDAAIGLMHSASLPGMTLIPLPREAHGSASLVDSAAVAALAGVDWAKVVRPEPPFRSYGARALMWRAQQMTPGGISQNGYELAVLEKREGYAFSDYTRYAGIRTDGPPSGSPASPLYSGGMTGRRPIE